MDRTRVKLQAVGWTTLLLSLPFPLMSPAVMFSASSSDEFLVAGGLLGLLGLRAAAGVALLNHCRWGRLWLLGWSGLALAGYGTGLVLVLSQISWDLAAPAVALALAGLSYHGWVLATLISREVVAALDGDWSQVVEF